MSMFPDVVSAEMLVAASSSDVVAPMPLTASRFTIPAVTSPLPSMVVPLAVTVAAVMAASKLMALAEVTMMSSSDVVPPMTASNSTLPVPAAMVRSDVPSTVPLVAAKVTSPAPVSVSRLTVPVSVTAWWKVMLSFVVVMAPAVERPPLLAAPKVTAPSAAMSASAVRVVNPSASMLTVPFVVVVIVLLMTIVDIESMSMLPLTLELPVILMAPTASYLTDAAPTAAAPMLPACSSDPAAFTLSSSSALVVPTAPFN